MKFKKNTALTKINVYLISTVNK